MGYHLNGLDKPVFMAVPKPLLTEFGIHYRLESFSPVLVIFIRHQPGQLGVQRFGFFLETWDHLPLPSQLVQVSLGLLLVRVSQVVGLGVDGRG